MGRPIVLTVTPPTASANGIATAQSLGAAGALTLNGSLVSGGVATLSAPGRIGITSVSGDDSGITFTVTGTTRSQQGGIVQSETITGPTAGATVSTTQDFATVTQVTGSGATAANVTVGPTGVGSSQWVPWSQYASDFQVQWDAFVISGGSPKYTVDYTPDDVFGTWLPAGVPFPRAVAGGQNVANTSGQFSFPVRATRLTVLTAATVQLTQTQQGS